MLTGVQAGCEGFSETGRLSKRLLRPSELQNEATALAMGMPTQGHLKRYPTVTSTTVLARRNWQLRL
jgi:hypothetical protein